MTERIGIEITKALAGVCNIMFAEAESDSYPYAVYNYTPVAKRTKDGINGWKAQVTISVVSPEYDEADFLSNKVVDTIRESQMDGVYAALVEARTDCSEGVWIMELVYNCNQIR